jgi:4-diphosphocytidyl-2-C-methyl-D-erythritol kinase
MRTWDEVAEQAPAKVNLYLHVTGRRADGYHLLDSLVGFADVGDQIELRAAKDLTLTLSGPFAALVPDGRDNLVLRAALAAAERFGRTALVAITLRKMLPVAAGIGGGSADAAAVLRALCRLWGENADDPRWLEIAQALGADVPVCFVGRTTRVGGIGEVLTPAPTLPDIPAVLVNALEPVPTPPVFKARTGPFGAADPLLETPDDLTSALAARRNDLTDAATRLHPCVGTVLRALRAQTGCTLARMSGSGGTCFGLFATFEAAELAAVHLLAAQPGWWVAPTTLRLAPRDLAPELRALRPAS